MSTLLLIDGNAILHRAFHALPPFKTKDGTPTNAVYGFATMILKAVNDFKPEYIAVCFDTPVPTFRKKLHKEYQAHRPKMDEGLVPQFPLTKEFLQKAGIAYLEKEGFEADDVIGTLAKNCADDKTVIILTGDRDIMQLITDHIFVVTPLIGLSTIKMYDKKEVLNKLQVNPEQIPDFKALAGDQSDNYKGAKGIGPKTAADLLKTYSSIDNLFSNLDQIQNERIKNILISEKENIMLSHQLATIHTKVDIDCNLEKLRFNKFNEELKEFFNKLEMHSLLKRYFPELKQKETKKPVSNNDPQMNLF